MGFSLPFPNRIFIETGRMSVALKKPLVIMTVQKNRKVGVIVSSLKELQDVGKDKLGLEIAGGEAGCNIFSLLCGSQTPGLRVVTEEDGIDIDSEEYFQTVQANTRLVLIQPGENWPLPASAPPAYKY